MGLGRLLGGGAEIPADAVVSVGAVDRAWSYGECAYVVGLGAAGPVRVHYSMSEPAGPTWLRLVEVSERKRRRVLGAVLGCGVLDGGVRPLREGPDGVGRVGWLHVAARGLSAWTNLPPGGRVGGVAVVDLVAGLVPGSVWRELHARRTEAWQDWARRAGAVPLPEVDRTRRDGGGGFDPEATRRQAVDQGPWDRPVAGRRAGEGWPGIRRGGGMGGAW